MGYAPQAHASYAYVETQRRQAAELRVLEEELRMAKAGEAWPAQWLQGPASCIEHEARCRLPKAFSHGSVELWPVKHR